MPRNKRPSLVQAVQATMLTSSGPGQKHSERRSSCTGSVGLGSSFLHKDVGERSSGMRQLTSTENVAALLQRLQETNAEAREAAVQQLGKHLASAAKEGWGAAVESALQAQRDVQRGDSVEMAALLHRRPRLLDVHRQRVIAAEQHTHQQHLLEEDLNNALQRQSVTTPQPTRLRLTSPAQREHSAATAKSETRQPPAASRETATAPETPQPPRPAAAQDATTARDMDIHVQEDRSHWQSMIGSTLGVFTAVQPSAALASVVADKASVPMYNACLICRSRGRTRSYPCGHLCVCDVCEQRSHCPVCATPMQR